MRVGIDATCWSNRRGYGRFTRGLLGRLLETDRTHEYVLFVDAQTQATETLPEQGIRVVVPTAVAPTQAASASGRRSLRDVWAMSTAVSRYALDAVFFPSVYTYFPVLTRARIILGVHDVIAEDYPDLVFPDRRGRWMWTLKGKLAHAQAGYVMTVSEHARAGILRRFGHRPDRVRVVGEAPDEAFRPLSAAEIDRGLLGRHGVTEGTRFFVYLGGINPHKNLGALLQALGELREDPEHADVVLVVVGDLSSEVFTPGLRALRADVDRLGLNDAVIFTGYLGDEEVVHCFNAALALVLPSFAEGFGLPGVEAAACACPIVATRNSPLPDLIEGGGIFIDPTRTDELTRALRTMVGDTAGRAQMAKRAREQAGRLTWDRAADQMRDLLDAVAADRG
jgi:glycosyltransferase involved in cell wall biosynthesis